MAAVIHIQHSAFCVGETRVRWRLPSRTAGQRFPHVEDAALQFTLQKDHLQQEADHSSPSEPLQSTKICLVALEKQVACCVPTS